MTNECVRKDAPPALPDELPALTRPCTHCTDYRRRLEQLGAPPKGVTVRAVVYSADERELRTEGETYPPNMRVDCPYCHNTGLVPTLWGWRLVSLVAVFLKDAPKLEDVKAAEIPF